VDKNSTQYAALVVLLDRLRDDITRNDGDSAVATMELIRAVAGYDVAMQIMDTLITAAIQRIAEEGRS
jgi:hypothetical protein